MAARRSGLAAVAVLPAAAVMLALAPGRLMGQQGDTTRVVEVPEVVVTVTRTPLELRRAPYSITRIVRTPSERAQPGLALDGALRLVPGVQVDNRYNHALGERISVRGMGARAQFGVRGVRVIFDGIPATLPDGQTSLSHVDPAFVERVEVIRGPASGLWGNAAGGVIQMSTVLPYGRAPYVRGGVTAGSHELLRTGVASGGGSADGAYLVQVSRLGFGGYREFNDARTLRGHARGAHRIGGGEVEVVVGGVDYDARNPGSLAEASLREDPDAAYPNNVRQRTGERGAQWHLGATWRGPTPAGALEWSSYFLDRGIDNPIPPQIIDLDRRAGGTRAVLSGELPSGTVVGGWAAGLEAELQRDHRRNHVNVEGERGERTLDQAERVRGLAAFGQLSLTLGGRLTAVAALRHDRFRFAAADRLITGANPDDSGVRYLAATSPALGVSLELSPRLHVFGNATTSFETPTTTELANRSDGAGGFNPGLRPQRALSLEAGGRIRPWAGAALEATLYRIALEDALVPFEIESAPGRQYFRNAGTATHRGLEAGMSLPLGRSMVLRSAYTLTDARFGEFTVSGEDHSGNRVPGVAPHRLDAALTRRLSGGGSVSLEARHASEMPVDDANQHTADPYTILDARAALPLGLGDVRGSVLLGVTNLTGARYVTSVVVNAFGGRYYEPGPPRSVYVGLTIGGPGGRRSDGR